MEKIQGKLTILSDIVAKIRQARCTSAGSYAEQVKTFSL